MACYQTRKTDTDTLQWTQLQVLLGFHHIFQALIFYCIVLGNVIARTGLCNQQHDEDTELFPHHEGPPCAVPFPPHIPHPHPGRQLSACPPSLWFCHLSKLCKRNYTVHNLLRLAFFGQHTVLEIHPSCYMHLTVLSFLSLSSSISLSGCTRVCSSIHSLSTDGHLGCFQSLPFPNTAAMYNKVEDFVQT